MKLEKKMKPQPQLTPAQLKKHYEQIEQAKEELEPFKDQFAIVTSERFVLEYIRRARDNGVLAIDTETTGLDEFRDKIVGFSLATPNFNAIYVPLLHVDPETGWLVEGQLNRESAIKAMEAIKESDIELVMHNANFDSRMILNNFGVSLTSTWDTYIMAKLLNENERSYSLKYLYDKYVGTNSKSRKFSELFKEFKFAPIRVGGIYAANDALITLDLFNFQKKFVDGDGAIRYGLEGYLDVFRSIEMKLQPIVRDIEEVGIKYDSVYGAEMEKVYESLLEESVKAFNKSVEPYKDKIEEWIDKYSINKTKTKFEKGKKLEYPVNFASPTQKAILLYDIIGLDNSNRKRGKERSTDKAHLSKYDHPTVLALDEISLIQKQLTTYVRAFPILAEFDGRIHTHFNQVGAVTYRFSSSNTNLQNISSKNGDIRKAFIATEGYRLISCDYSKQEIVVATEFANDKKMREALKSGRDVYSEIASLIFHLPYEECTEHHSEEGSKRRYQAKQVTLSLLYGKQTYTLAKDLGITTKEAQELTDKFFNSFSGVRDWISRTIDSAKRYGYVKNLQGIKRRLPILLEDDYVFEPLASNTVTIEQKRKYINLLSNAWGNSQREDIINKARKELILIKDNTYKKAQAERQCVNAPIQSSASYMVKKAMIAIDADKKLKELGYRMLIPIHDEILGEAPEEHAEECSKIVSKIMVDVNKDLSTPISVDTEITTAWQEKESYTYMTEWEEVLDYK